MITNETLYRQGRRLLIAAFLLSFLLHGAGALVWGYFSGRVPWLEPRPKPETIVVLSSATTIRHETVPVPVQLHREVQTTQSVDQHPSRAEQSEDRVRVTVAAAPPARRELTYTAPSAPPTPAQTSAPAARQPAPMTALQRDEAMFRREVAQLQARNNPMSVATISPRPASSYRRSYVNISGVDRNQETYEGIVTPTQTWFDGQRRCHYASYDVEYSSGASDRGSIPWPLCYALDHDPMVLPDGQPVPNGSPVPPQDLYPMEGYVLPPGTYLTQFLRLLYSRQF